MAHGRSGASSWLVNVALEVGTPEQRALLADNYGRKDAPEAVTRVKELYRTLGLPARFAAYEEDSHARLSARIAAVTDARLPPVVFTKFMQKIYKRTK
jgi:farnesyl diphosphate synthase